MKGGLAMKFIRVIVSWLSGIFSSKSKQSNQSETKVNAGAKGFSFKAETHHYPYDADHPLSRPDLFHLVGDIIMPRPDADQKELFEWLRLHGCESETGTGGRNRDLPVPPLSK